MIVLSTLEIYVNNKVLWGLIIRHIISSPFKFELLLLPKIMLCKEAKIIKIILLYILGKKLELAIQNAKWHYSLYLSLFTWKKEIRIFITPNTTEAVLFNGLLHSEKIVIYWWEHWKSNLVVRNINFKCIYFNLSWYHIQQLSVTSGRWRTSAHFLIHCK